MPKRCVPEIMRQRNRLHKIAVKAQRFCDRARDLAGLKRMRKPRAVIIAFVIDKNLSFIFQPAKRRAVHDAITISLESRTVGMLFFFTDSSAALRAFGRVRSECRQLPL